MTPTRPLTAYLALMRAAEGLTDRIHAPLTALSLTVGQFGVLEALFHLGPLRPSDLAEKILRSCGNITVVVTNLERRRLVRRKSSKADRRSKVIELTNQGRTVMEEFFPRHTERVAAELSPLSAAEQKELIRLCGKLRQPAGGENERP